MGMQEDVAARLGMLDGGVSRLAEDAISLDLKSQTIVELGVQHLQATAAVEQAHALHRIAEALEALGRGEQIRA